MSPEHLMLVRFWGVRGAIASPGPGTVRYGGNTSCVEVRCGKRTVIFDAGSGIRKLGDALMAEGGDVNADILFGHCHMDHVVGVPFFAPFYAAGHHVRLWAGHLSPSANLKSVIHTIMSPPLFPIEMDAFQAKVEFHDFRTGDDLNLGEGISIRTAALNHPGGATGYRLEYAGRAVAYLTDTEHKPGELDANVLSLAAGADLMIYDCTYTDEQFGDHVGWGHSTWQQAVRLAEAAGAKSVAIFHHEPEHDDAFMDRIAKAAQNARAGTFVAREGLELSI
jgi:phosphoribosyl 1,2-cyclic phosphodiesterase